MPSGAEPETPPRRYWDGVGARARFVAMGGRATSRAASGSETSDAPRFIRIDRDRWMFVANFRAAVGWNDGKAAAVARILREALGSAPFLPIALLSSSVLDALPELSLDGAPLRWTPELAASVAALLCPGCHVANHGSAPFAVTTLLVPRPVAPDEVVRYALGIYAARNPHAQSVEGAFEFLKANSIKFRLTKNCREEIARFLGRQEEEKK